MTIKRFVIGPSTSNFDNTPPVGFKWILRYCAVYLQAGSGVGNRRAYAQILPGGGIADEITGEAVIIADTGSVTATTTANMAPSSGTNQTEVSYLPVLSSYDTLQCINSGILSGDEVTQAFEVEEVTE